MAIFNLGVDDLRRRTSIKWRRFEPDVLPMFVAEMDSPLPPAVAEALSRAISDGDTGYPELPVYQESFADFAAWMWGWSVDPTADVKLACDVMTGMREVLLATTEPGDVVVINPPIYPPFRAITTGTGRVISEVPMRADGRLDLDGLAEAFARQPRPAAYLLCSPHNPNGTVHTREELAAVATLAAEHGVVVIADEIHAPLSGDAHTPFTTLPGAEESFVVTSASKSFNLAGLKAGLIVAGPGGRGVLRGLPGWVAESASHLAIIAHSAALDGSRAWLAELSAEIRANKEHLADELAAHLPQLQHRPSEGTYLEWVDCSALGLANPARTFHEVGRVRFGVGTDYARDAGQFVRINVATSRALISDGVSRMAASLR